MPSSFESDKLKIRIEKNHFSSSCFVGGQRLIVLNCEDLAEMRYDGEANERRMKSSGVTLACGRDALKQLLNF